MAWPLRASHFVEMINPLWSTHVLRARVVAVWDETSDTRTLTLRPGRGFEPHRAGQFIRLGVVTGGMHQTRTYSISSEPGRDDGCITITVKAHEGGRVSRHLVRETRVKDYVTIGQPQGDFVLPEAPALRPLFISGGSGVTPIRSMVRTLARSGRLDGVTHVHYAPRARDVIFGAELRELARRHPGYRLHEVLTREEHDAHFSAEQLERLCPDFRERDAYVCGPEPLLGAVQASFADAGLASRLHIERFAARLAPPPGATSAGRVRFSKSEAYAESDGRTSLLVLAERAGLNPRHGCRMGICHECTTVLKAGCVRDLRTNELTNEPGTTVQPCVCAASGDAELEL
jgi:ferredoxin-NADP reductase